MTYEPERPDKKFLFDPKKFVHNIPFKDYKNRKFIEYINKDTDEDDFDDEVEKEDL